MLFQLKRTDDKQSLVYVLQNEDGTTPILTGASVQFVMGKKNKLIVNNPAIVQSATDGIVAYNFTNADTLMAGNYIAEFVVTYPNGERQTFPSSGYIGVSIEPNLDTNQANIIVDIVAERQGEFTEKLNSILAQAGNINMSAMNEYEWIAEEGQLIYVFPSSSKYDIATKWFEVQVGNLNVPRDLINRNVNNQFELLIDPVLIKAGTSVYAKWTEPIIPIVDSYQTVQFFQQDTIPENAEVGALWLDESDNALQGTIFENLEFKLTQNEKKIENRELNVLFPPSLLVPAKGDGVADDSEALFNLHMYANQYGLKVVYPTGIFKLITPKGIPVRTDVDFSNATIIVDESALSGTLPFFDIQATTTETNTLDATQKATLITELKKGATKLSTFAQRENIFVIVTDDNSTIMSRQGGTGEVLKKNEWFYVSQNGTIVGDIVNDFTDYTNITIKSGEERYLTIKGGSFVIRGNTSTGSGYKYHLFRCQRSKVTFENQNWTVESDNQKNPVWASYLIDGCYDVSFKNIKGLSRQKDRSGTTNDVSDGTYNFRLQKTVHVNFENITTFTVTDNNLYWGSVMTRETKKTRYVNCRMNRIDSHMQAFDVTIRDTVVNGHGILMHGGGKLILDNVRTYNENSNGLVDFRYDWGAHWDGDIIINNCEVVIDSDKTVSLLRFVNDGIFNYNYNIQFGRRIKVNNVVFKFLNSALTNEIRLINLPSHSIINGGSRIRFPNEIDIKNVYVDGRDKGVRVIDHATAQNFYLDKVSSTSASEVKTNAKIYLENVQMDDVTAYGTRDSKAPIHFIFSASGDANSVCPEVRIEKCNSLYLRMALVNGVFNIRNQDINHIDLGATKMYTRLILENVNIKPTFNADDGFSIYRIDTNLDNSFINCVIFPIVANGSEVTTSTAFNRYQFMVLNDQVKHIHVHTRLSKSLYDALTISGLSEGFIDLLDNQNSYIYGESRKKTPSKPTSGNYRVGQIVWCVPSLANQPIGWICTATSPLTFRDLSNAGA